MLPCVRLAGVLLLLGDVTIEWVTQILVVVLLAALSITLIFLGTYLRRAGSHRHRHTRVSSLPKTVPPRPVAATRRSSPSVRTVRVPTGTTGGLAVAASPHGPVACPACRREFSPNVRFCPYDARRVVPLGELGERSRIAGSICPRCRRGYEAGVRTCVHDSEELIASPIWEVTHGRQPELTSTGVTAKICPQCTGRYDLATRFCTRDGVELMTIN